MVAETYDLARVGTEWAASYAELAESSRRNVRSDVLSLRSASKDDTAIQELHSRRDETLATRSSTLVADEVFRMFINAYLTAVDP